MQLVHSKDSTSPFTPRWLPPLDSTLTHNPVYPTSPPPACIVSPTVSLSPRYFSVLTLDLLTVERCAPLRHELWNDSWDEKHGSVRSGSAGRRWTDSVFLVFLVFQGDKGVGLAGPSGQHGPQGLKVNMQHNNPTYTPNIHTQTPDNVSHASDLVLVRQDEINGFSGCVSWPQSFLYPLFFISRLAPWDVRSKFRGVPYK